MKRNALLLSLLTAVGCTGDIAEGDGPEPSLLAISQAEVSIGRSLEFIGQDFLSGEDGYTEVQLEGTYETTEGEQVPVDMIVRPHWMSATRLMWANVGPFKVPFTPGGVELGTFEGTATAINVLTPSKERTPGVPIPIELTIGPSVIIKDLQPVGSSCEEPAKRLLGGFPYRIEVAALGFEPINFTYELIGEAGPEVPRVFRQEAKGNSAILGEKGEIVLAPVADDVLFYVAELLITARNAEGQQISTVYAFGVHNPIEYIDWGTPQIAQIEEPQPVSGCISGGINGQHVGYDETHAETRERQVSYHYDETWVSEHSTNYSTSHEERHGVNMNLSRNTEYGWDTNWQHSGTDGISGNAGFNFFGIVNAGVQVEHSTTGSVGGSRRGSVSSGWTVGHDYSTADTESWAYTNSNSYSVASGTGNFFSVSSSDTISKSNAADIIPTMYGVWYRQVTRIERPGTVVAYNLCGQPMVIADAIFPDYTWAVSMSQAAECPPIPKSTLPEAQCIRAPCSGN